MEIHQILSQITKNINLTKDEAADVMKQLMSGNMTPAQTAAFLTAMHMKGETVEEITGFAETMRSFSTKVTTIQSPLVDTCGTGGDHSGTFNISTTAAFVAAGAGVAIAKHGNRSATSKCGSADVLETLGVNIDASPDKVGQCIDDVGIGFLFARTLHSAMKHVGPVRTELKIRTVFNILGPLTNPAGADGQVMGIFDSALLLPIAKVLNALGTRHAFVVSGNDGLDEISLCTSSAIAEVKDGKINNYTLNPEDIGFSLCSKEELHGGDASENAEILLKILQGEKSPRRDIVILNAAPAIAAGKKAESINEGIKLAVDSIDSGAALEKLKMLKKVSNDS